MIPTLHRSIFEFGQALGFAKNIPRCDSKKTRPEPDVTELSTAEPDV